MYIKHPTICRQDGVMSYPARIRSQLAVMIREKAYKVYDEPVALSSGKTSKFYFDIKSLALSRDGRDLFRRVFEVMIYSGNYCVAGMEFGAVPLVMIAGEVLVKDVLVIRKGDRDHGTMQKIEGLGNVDMEGDRIIRVAIIDDVVTTGKSILKACKAVTDAGLLVHQIFCVVNRMGGDDDPDVLELKEGLRAYDRQDYVCKLESLFTLGTFGLTTDV